MPFQIAVTAANSSSPGCSNLPVRLDPRAWRPDAGITLLVVTLVVMGLLFPLIGGT
jgi:hypothetical protein